MFIDIGKQRGYDNLELHICRYSIFIHPSNSKDQFWWVQELLKTCFCHSHHHSVSFSL